MFHFSESLLLGTPENPLLPVFDFLICRMLDSKQKQTIVRDLPWSPLNQFVGGSYDRNSQKTHRVNASLSTLEFHALKEDAQRCSVSISARLRDLGLGALKKLTPDILHREEETRKSFERVYQQFFRIGGNINQIARAMNIANKKGEYPKIEALGIEAMKRIEQFSVSQEHLMRFIRSNRAPIHQLQEASQSPDDTTPLPHSSPDVIRIHFDVRKGVHLSLVCE